MKVSDRCHDTGRSALRDVFEDAVAAALTAGAGTALRLAADYAVARTGGSLTGYEPGDNWPGEDQHDEAD